MGLINSSLARAIKKHDLAEKLTATSRSKTTRLRVKELNLVNEVRDTIEDAVRDADLVIVGIPVAAYRKVFKEIVPNLKAGSILTDVGSVKKSVMDDIYLFIPEDVSFM